MKEKGEERGKDPKEMKGGLIEENNSERLFEGEPKKRNSLGKISWECMLGKIPVEGLHF
ncbi:hypothetical protein [Ligilactobacillus salivarius]|uniref:hypothetical protein n=1 Tax=Ligilactobacillus salivarius TaxID=1624 RepID=UPI0024575C08|nr:hypothetical protein [Ligilactobacillus salivarius]MDH4961109.1 hypothetical protein [Ligilactobacillus salivarius]